MGFSTEAYKDAYYFGGFSLALKGSLKKAIFKNKNFLGDFFKICWKISDYH